MTAYQGIRVVDFSRGVAGPLTTMLLAQFGAEVVKVESSDDEHLRDTPAYLALNRNKSVLTLDLDNADDADRARALIAGADVAVFDHGPTRLRALGFDAEYLTKAHPALVHAWMPPYGVEGAWSDLPAHHILLSALVGWAWYVGADSDVPTYVVPQIGFYTQGILGAASVGAALYERSLSGRGQGVVVTGLHGCSLINFCRVMKHPLRPRSSTVGSHPRIRVYRCGDGGYFFLAAVFPSFYRKVFEVLGFGDMVDILLADDEGALGLLMATFATNSRDHWVKLLRDNDVPCAGIFPRETWFDGDTVRDAGLRLTLKHPTLGDVSMPNVSMEMSATPATVRDFPQMIPVMPEWAARDTDSSSEHGPGGALAGVRVLNLGIVVAGALPNAILSQLGADVIKVEPLDGDPYRAETVSLGFNRGSRSLAVDLMHPEGRAVFLDLVREADVVIDNYRPGVRARLGIDYATLKAINPRIISVSFSAYGSEGKRAAEPGFDGLLLAEGGFMAAQGGDDDPVFIPLAPLDVGGAATICASVIAALNARNRTGEGQEIRSSLLAQSLLYQIGELVTYSGRPASDKGSRDCPGLRALHRYYACADGWIGVACDRPAEAAALGRVLTIVIDAPEAALKEPRDGVLAERIMAALADRPREGVLAAMLKEGVPAVPVVRPEDAAADEWLWRNGYFANMEDPKHGTVLVAKGYGNLLGTPYDIPRGAPQLGAHSIEVLREYGISSDRIADLLSANAVRSSEPFPAAVGTN